MTDPETLPASRLGTAELAALFTRAYAGYPVPMRVDEAMLAMMMAVYDEDAESSVVLVAGGEPVALAMLGVRPPRGWIGGMGVVESHRRRGLGQAVMRAVLARARALGLTEVMLEVLEQNASAHALYESLGFVDVRRLEVWTLSAAAAGSAEGWLVEAAGPPQGPALERAPWQRDAATRARLSARPPGLLHFTVRSQAEAGRTAQVTLRDTGGALSLQDARGGGDAAWWAEAIAALLHARGGSTLRMLNVEAGGVLASAARAAGGVRDAAQREMRLELS